MLAGGCLHLLQPNHVAQNYLTRFYHFIIQDSYSFLTFVNVSTFFFFFFIKIGEPGWRRNRNSIRYFSLFLPLSSKTFHVLLISQIKKFLPAQNFLI